MGEPRVHPKKDENRHLRGRMCVRALLLISYGVSIMRNVVVVEGFRTPFCKEGTDFREIDADERQADRKDGDQRQALRRFELAHE